jgi:hypothetical protein
MEDSAELDLESQVFITQPILADEAEAHEPESSNLSEPCSSSFDSAQIVEMASTSHLSQDEVPHRSLEDLSSPSHVSGDDSEDCPPTPPLVMDRKRKRAGDSSPSIAWHDAKNRKVLMGSAEIASERKSLERQSFVNIHTPTYSSSRSSIIDGLGSFALTSTKWEESFCLPKNWPPHLTYTNVPIWPTLTVEKNFNLLPIGSFLTTHTIIQKVSTPDHPAYGQVEFQ